MHVVATAGHVDHGKSSLVRALTGMEPDRWAEERRRGMTIDLGFAWTQLPSGAEVAFVDVPGHERFVTNMLAGVGPVPAVLVVVAADEGWMPQTAEHVRALDRLGVGRGLLVVTKSDLADPEPVLASVRSHLAGTTLADIDAVAVSAETGRGLDELVAALDRLVAALPQPSVDAPLRLWVDRAFTISGAGTVVTGTLGAGCLEVGAELVLSPAGTRVTVRGLQSLGTPQQRVEPVARVAVNLRGVDRSTVSRGMALLTAGDWCVVSEVDVLVDGDVPGEVVTHLGAAAVPTRVRSLGQRSARLRLATPLPLHLGDRLLLREPSSRQVVAARVADLAPQALRRRGDAARIDASLTVPVTADDEVRRRGFAAPAWLRQAGLPGDPADARPVGGWWVSAEQWQSWQRSLADLTSSGGEPDGISIEAVRRTLALPGADLADALVRADPALAISDGRVVARDAREAALPELEPLLARLRAHPFAAPEGEEVQRIGRPLLARGVRAGRLLDLGGGVYVATDAPTRAVEVLAALEQPFTVSAARQALDGTRRVIVPLLEHLDAARVTRRLPDGTRVVVGSTR